MTNSKKKSKKKAKLSIDFQSFGPGETPEIRATVVADSHEDYVAIRDALLGGDGEGPVNRK